MDIKKILPKDGPPINEVSKYIEKYKDELIVIKYGGNVFIDRNIFNNFITDINILKKLGISIVIVHGGGPRIKRELEKSNIESKFIRGLRVTDEKIINIVENVLIDFNNDIVNSLIQKGSEAVSIHSKNNNIIEVVPEVEELGFVGIPNTVNSEFLITPEAKSLNELRNELMENFGILKNGCAGIIKNSSNEYKINGPLDLIEKVLEIGKFGIQVNRYKGLGEMNPDQLWETTLDKNFRSLLLVKIDEVNEANSLFETLMGEIVEGRRNFIQEHSLEVANLDI